MIDPSTELRRGVKLDKGSEGTVFKVKRIRDNKEFAMKIIKNTNSESLPAVILEASL